MTNAVIYARVSSREQQDEGYSIDAQLKVLRHYAREKGFAVSGEFVEAATAKCEGRKAFNEMLRFLKASKDCRTVLVEKTDRMYRNLRDYVTLEDLDIALHLVKENQIISKDSKSYAQFMHGIRVLMARNYSLNLKEEVEKGMLEKAEQGHYPAMAPFGYRNNRDTRAIDPHSGKAPVVKRIFELYASGKHSLSTLRTAIVAETGYKLSRANLEVILKNRFYIGMFTWKKREFIGKHSPLIDVALFNRVQQQFASKNRPKYQKHHHAFAGLVVCGNDGHQFTAERQKGKYVYYRCSDYGREKCRLPFIREEELSDRLGQTLADIHIPDDVYAQLCDSFERDAATAHQQRERRV